MYKKINTMACCGSTTMPFKFLFCMKFILILMFAFSLQLSAETHAQKINLNVKNAPIEKVFKALRNQGNFNFYYEDDLIKNAKPITINAVNENLESVLEKCFANQPFTFTINQNTIVLRKKEIPVVLKPVLADITVTGKILDENNQPIPGASVNLKGAKLTVQTSTEGEFIIKVPEDATLIVSYVGYETTEVAVEKRRSFNVSLKPVNNALNEVIVVAYGQKQKKIETLGAQSSLNVQELKQPVANLSTVLAGRVSGLVGVQRSAEPGLDGADIFIRGLNTTSNNAPLILVDGVERSFSNLDPNDVEGFTILKDASSTSVYGVRGANGVILVTTKKGVAGKTRFNFDYYQGVTEFTTIPKAADGVTYLQMANEANTTRGGSPRYSEDVIRKTFTKEDPILYPNVNWMEEIFNNFGNNRKANMNVSGGSDKATFYVSAGLYSENGLFKTDDLQKYDSKISFDRYNFASRLNINATKSTVIDLGIKGFIGNGNYPGTGTSEIFAEAFETYPTIYPSGLYPNGQEPFVSTGGGMNSPYGLLTNRGYVSTYNNQINSDIRVIQDLSSLVKGLSTRVLFAFDARNTNRLARIKAPASNYARSRDANGNLVYDIAAPSGSDFLVFSKDNGGERQFYLEGAVSYDNTFGKHHIGGLLLYNQTDKVISSATTLILSLPYRNLGLVGRATYSYNEKYLAEVSLGYNGAENFAPSKRFGYFPSYAIGWVVSNEKFFGNIQKTFQLLKLRASYGIVGNSKINIFSSDPDARDRFTYLAQVASAGGYSFGQTIGSNTVNGLAITRFASDVTWETEKDINLGLEFKTFNNALYVQIDFFNRRRENIFLQRASVPNFVGLPANLLGNLGENNSKGIDITGEFSKRMGKFDVQFRGTFTYNKNKVIENDQPLQQYDYQESRGWPIRQRFGYISEGYYTQAEIDNPSVARTAGGTVQAGDIKFRDLNGDGIISEFDQTAIGRSSLPQIVYGFGTSIAYKGFSLGAFFQGIGNVDLYLSNVFMPFRSGPARGSVYENILDRWTPENPSQDAFYPRLSYGADINQNYSATSSHWLMNGKFLRLKTLDFGYTFPKTTFTKVGVKNMRVYFIGYNLLTFSPYKMFDPEMGDGSGTRYPNIKTYSLGLNVSF
ncbi:TonB-dependent receptor [Pedobacter polaris]|uniref:TonB-dependent receptor n=2 Tax=Pedobacter polaris TaxID=2571273 RepID=A0A4U1CV41_9SPHI|nr:TonB-dependent receptor [Pedobacter polaris]